MELQATLEKPNIGSPKLQEAADGVHEKGNLYVLINPSTVYDVYTRHA